VPNSCRMVVVASSSSLVGLMKIAASSTYIEVFHLAAARGSLERTPCYVAMSISRCSGSMARMKSMGERGSPCRTPLLWLKAGPCCPLSSTFDEAVRKRIESHSRHRGPKLNAYRTSNMQGQLTASKALCISSSKKLYASFACACFAPCSERKGSCHGCSFSW
jgi:hypothetical protein